MSSKIVVLTTPALKWTGHICDDFVDRMSSKIDRKKLPKDFIFWGYIQRESRGGTVNLVWFTRLSVPHGVFTFGGPDGQVFVRQLVDFTRGGRPGMVIMPSGDLEAFKNICKKAGMEVEAYHCKESLCTS